MNIYTNKRRWKLFLLIGAIAIGSFTLWYTQNLVEQLKEQERQRMSLWADAMRELTLTNNDPNTPSFIFEIIKNNKGLFKYPFKTPNKIRKDDGFAISSLFIFFILNFILRPIYFLSA